MASLTRIARFVVCFLTLLLLATEVGCKKSEGPAAPSPSSPATARPAEARSQLPAVPAGLPPIPIPSDNPMAEAKVELGKMLYFDKRLSKDGTVACASCHDPAMGWAEHHATSEGIGKQMGGRNAPTVVNAAYMPAQFWDGRAKSLEEQALGPIENPIEMGNNMGAVTADLVKISEYKKRFKDVFGSEEITNDRVAKAIAAFERTILSGESPYDRFKAGDKKALTEAQQRGMEIFMGRGECNTCHTEPIFSKGGYYNAGVDSGKPNPDPGLKKITGKDGDMGKFRVPHLREVANTGPYFHDGSAKTLEEAVALMGGGGKDNPNLSSMLKAVRDAKLTDQDRNDLVEFLKALSGKLPEIDVPKQPS